MNRKAAKVLIIAHLNGELSSEELKNLYDWMAKKPENTRYYVQIKDLWETSHLKAYQEEITDKGWIDFLEKISDETVHSKNPHNFRKTFLLIAAVFIFGLIIGSGFDLFLGRGTTKYFSVTAPKGAIACIQLPDRSIVYLNAESTVRYALDSRSAERRIELTGEAWFNVFHDSSHPFIVHTDAYDIRVHGTHFDVKAYEGEDKVTTTLEKGSVEILGSGQFVLKKKLLLIPGEQFAYNKKTKSGNLKNVNPELFSSWKDNQLQFIKLDLKELIVLLERKYGVTIKVTNPEVLRFHYSGTLKNESILEVMDILSTTLPINYHIKDQSIIISSK